MNTENFSSKLEEVLHLIDEADYILIGAGAGLSASGGLDYSNTKLFRDWFPNLVDRGITTLWQGLSSHWRMTPANARKFWGYWATHISKIRYETPVLKPYQQLYELLKDKNHFIITTNVDYQFYKAGFSSEKIFAPQGDYGLFQCERPCSNKTYLNESYIQKMIAGINNETNEINGRDIPYCPNCGAYMSKNIRVDDTFIESPHMVNQKSYTDFVKKAKDGKLVLIELGVGYNTPVIIRWPFDKIARNHKQVTLIRMNTHHPELPVNLKKKGVSFNGDISEILNQMIRLNKK